MLALVVRFDLPDEAAASAFDAATRAVMPGIAREEPGTLLYLPSAVDGEPLVRVFYELYTDAGAHAAHEARPATAAFLDRVRELVTSVRVERCEPMDDGKGLPSTTVLV